MLEDDLLATALKRQPNTLEARLLYREPRCGLCWDRECDVEAREGVEEAGGEGRGWRLCGGCRVMPWCSRVHEEEGREEHAVMKGEDGRTQVSAWAMGGGLVAMGGGWRSAAEGRADEDSNCAQCETYQLSNEIDE